MEMWLDADGVTLTISMPEPDGRPLVRDTIEGVYLKSKFGSSDGEIIRMSYQPASDPDDPDAPPAPRKFVRLVLEELPPPRTYVAAEAAHQRGRCLIGTSCGCGHPFDQAAANALARDLYGDQQVYAYGDPPPAPTGLHSPGGPGL